MDELFSLLNFRADPDLIERVKDIIAKRSDLRERLEKVTNEKNPIVLLTTARDVYSKLIEDEEFINRMTQGGDDEN